MVDVSHLTEQDLTPAIRTGTGIRLRATWIDGPWTHGDISVTDGAYLIIYERPRRIDAIDAKTWEEEFNFLVDTPDKPAPQTLSPSGFRAFKSKGDN